MSVFLGLVSAKGGVGKTTSSINLASALAHYNIDSVVVDADFMYSNVSLHLGFPDISKNLNGIVDGKFRISDCIFKHSSGVHFIPSSTLSQDYHNNLIPNLSKHLAELHGTIPVVIIDSGDDAFHSFHVLKSCLSSLIVCDYSHSSLHDSAKFVSRAASSGFKLQGIILNKFSPGDESLPISKFEQELGLPILGIIPYDESVRQSFALRHPVVFSHPDSPSSIGFRRLAVNLIGGNHD